MQQIMLGVAFQLDEISALRPSFERRFLKKGRKEFEYFYIISTQEFGTLPVLCRAILSNLKGRRGELNETFYFKLPFRFVYL